MGSKVYFSKSIWLAYCIRSSADLNCCIGSMDVNMHLLTCCFHNTYGLLVYMEGTEKKTAVLWLCWWFIIEKRVSAFWGAEIAVLDAGTKTDIVPYSQAKVCPPVHDFLTAVSQHHCYAVASHKLKSWPPPLTKSFDSSVITACVPQFLPFALRCLEGVIMD